MEVLVATALTLVIMAVAVTLFAELTDDITGSRAVIESSDRLRSAEERLRLDLRGVTAPTNPPLDPAYGLGYFKYREGSSASQLSGVDVNGSPDQTIGDMNDILMFTSRSSGEPFLGRFGYDSAGNARVAQSQTAEVAWFVRGTTLYRRVLLIVPGRAGDMDSSGNGYIRGSGEDFTGSFYSNYDVSVRQVGGSRDPDQAMTSLTPFVVPNSLADLTRRETRYAHMPRQFGPSDLGFSSDISNWGQLGLPTLRECSDASWPLPLFGTNNPFSPPVPANVASTDLWLNPHPWANVDTDGTLSAYNGGQRYAEDVILTNVIGFDVKAWDPGAPVVEDASGNVLLPGDVGYGTGLTHRTYGAYVDLGYATGYTPGAGAPASPFAGLGEYRPGKYNIAALQLVYDTWSTHYESDGVDQDGDGLTDEGADGLDNYVANPANPIAHTTTMTTAPARQVNGVDDIDEQEAPPPYPAPLRGIQVKIRVFEPDSKQIREVTIVQDFLPE